MHQPPLNWLFFSANLAFNLTKSLISKYPSAFTSYSTHFSPKTSITLLFSALQINADEHKIQNISIDKISVLISFFHLHHISSLNYISIKQGGHQKQFMLNRQDLSISVYLIVRFFVNEQYYNFLWTNLLFMFVSVFQSGSACFPFKNFHKM